MGPGDGNTVLVHNRSKGRSFEARFDLSPRQREMILKGGLINIMREKETK